jgi:hypothetical protein
VHLELEHAPGIRQVSQAFELLREHLRLRPHPREGGAAVKPEAQPAVVALPGRASPLEIALLAAEATGATGIGRPLKQQDADEREALSAAADDA